MITLAASLFFAFALALAVLTITASFNAGSASAVHVISRYIDMLARDDAAAYTPKITVRMTTPIIPEFAQAPAPKSYRKVTAKILELPRAGVTTLTAPNIADYAKAA